MKLQYNIASETVAIKIKIVWDSFELLENTVRFSFLLNISNQSWLNQCTHFTIYSMFIFWVTALHHQVKHKSRHRMWCIYLIKIFSQMLNNLRYIFCAEYTMFTYYMYLYDAKRDGMTWIYLGEKKINWFVFVSNSEQRNSFRQ